MKSVNPGKYLVAKELNKLDVCANVYILFKSPKFAVILHDGDVILVVTSKQNFVI